MAVSNISDHLTAHATLEAPGAPAVTATVAPQSIGVLPLPGPMMCGTSQAALGYHLTTDAPVTAVQFNPLSASASGDASLLLPAQHLGTTYAVVSVPHGLQDDGGALPGLLAVVATEDGTQVHIQLAGGVASTQSALASGACASAPDNLAAQASQTSADYLLNRAEVLQLWTDASSSDLTGSMITSTSTQSGGGAPVAVFGGADCAAVPTGAASCDHLEEQLPPFGIWGKRYLGVKSQPYAGASSTYPDVWRLVSACGPGACPNGATVTITPPVASFHADPAHPSATCSTAGATTTCVLPSRSSSDTAPWIEFQHASTFVATSDQPALLAQYLVSQGTAGAQEGDPSLVLAPDASRWMSFNLVLAPASFAHNGLSLMIDGHSPSTCQSCGQVQVDGVTTPASEWANVPGTNYWAAVHPVCGKADPGCHPEHIISTTNGEPVGVVVYGYDSFVSYAYPGALGPPALVHIQPG